METSNGTLERPYGSFSDSELAEVFKSGTLSDKDTVEVGRILLTRGFRPADVGPTFSPKPVPRIWVGFIFAATVFVCEFLDEGLGIREKLGGGKLDLTAVASIFGFMYWLFCIGRFHTIVQRISFSTYPISPAAAVIKNFLPFYNLYWTVKWPITFTKFVKSGEAWIVPGLLTGMTILLGAVLTRVLDGSVGLAVMYCGLLYTASKLRKRLRETTERERIEAQGA